MGSGVGIPDLAVYRLLKGGEAGLNLSLLDLYGKEIEAPSLRAIIRSFFTGKPLSFRIRSVPEPLVRKLTLIQSRIDEEVKKATDKAKRQAK